MKHIPSDKYNIAWFTLAECVSRGEKIRAMSLYRLLSHSIKDEALATQLKGDLLLAFEDTSAADLYEQAAELYLKENRTLEAVAVFEHLHTLDVNNTQYLTSLIKGYKKLEIYSKISSYIEMLCNNLCKTGNTKTICAAISKLEDISDHKQAALIHKAFILYMLQKKPFPVEEILDMGKLLVEHLFHRSQKELDQFLSHVEQLDTDYYFKLYQDLEKS